MNTYLLYKSIHLIAVFSWMAGLLYLPRIFVYHSETPTASSQSETFKIMEKKLMNYIMNPAMVASWVFGILLIHSQGSYSNVLLFLWIKIKLLLVVLMTIYHFLLIVIIKEFKNDTNKRSSKFYRLFNEIPTLILIGIVFVVIFKPL